jgi:hypothetical protein
MTRSIVRAAAAAAVAMACNGGHQPPERTAHGSAAPAAAPAPVPGPPVRLRFAASLPPGDAGPLSDGLAHAVAELTARFTKADVPATAQLDGSDGLVVELSAPTPVNVARVRALARDGKLAVEVVDDGAAWSKKVLDKVADGKDPAAAAAGITGQTEHWPGNPAHTDYFLLAHDQGMTTGRDALAKFLADLAAADASFAIGSDHAIGYERATTTGPSDPRPAWRTYYLLAKPELDNEAIQSASVGSGASPRVTLELTPDATKAFTALTTRIAGKRLAFVIDDAIAAAPIIDTPVTTGRTTLHVQPGPPGRQDLEATALAEILGSGQYLGVVLREVR